MRVQLVVYSGHHETGDLKPLLISRDPDVARAAIQAALTKVDRAEVSEEGLQAVFMGLLRGSE